MVQELPSPLAELIDQDLTLGLDELCRACDLPRETLLEWLAEGVAEPRSHDAIAWSFSARQFRRLRVAGRLSRDLQIDTPALPLVLDLLEEIEQLRARLRVLRGLLDDS